MPPKGLPKKRTNAQRRRAYQRLRNAGYSPAEARRLRDDPTVAANREDRNTIRKRRVAQLRAAGVPPKEASKLRDKPKEANRVLARRRRGASLAKGLPSDSPTAKRLRSGDRDTRDDRWSRWSKRGDEQFPTTILRVRESFRRELQSQGRDRHEVDARVFGLVWQWYQGEFEFSDLRTDGQLFEQYPR